MSPPSDANSAMRATAPPAVDNKSAAPPHTGSTGAVAEAERVAARHASESDPAVRPGTPVSRRSPFLIGMAAAASQSSPEASS